MRKKWGNLLNTFTIIFVLCLIPTAYGQEKIPESQAIDIIEKMHEMENRIRDHIDKKFTEQNGKITELGKKWLRIAKQLSS